MSGEVKKARVIIELGESVRVFQEGKADYALCLDTIEAALLRLSEEGGAWIEEGVRVDMLVDALSALSLITKHEEDKESKDVLIGTIKMLIVALRPFHKEMIEGLNDLMKKYEEAHTGD